MRNQRGTYCEQVALGIVDQQALGSVKRQDVHCLYSNLRLWLLSK